ncbi:hypothetical protein BGZ74_002714 [Mortierella antarctica]|nr:hypothetical protein BGZ74_002714 [Mortierella antarctica]
MLQGCLNLRSLFLSIFSEDCRVERVLAKEDLIVAPKSDNSEHANQAFHPDGAFKTIDAQSLLGSGELVREIEALVTQGPRLQPIVDKVLAEKRALREKEQRETKCQKQFRLAPPKRVAVPSLKTLQIYCHWIIRRRSLN